jgi:hypothetical protein
LKRSKSDDSDKGTPLPPRLAEFVRAASAFFFFFFFESMGFISKSTFQVVLTVPATLHAPVVNTHPVR